MATVYPTQTGVRIVVPGQGIPGPPGAPGPAVNVETLPTAGAVGTVPTSNGSGGLDMLVPAGSGNVVSPGSETAGRIAKFTGSNNIDETTVTEAQLTTLTDSSNADTLHTHADFDDATLRIQDNADVTKEIAFQASTITTGTVRTITMPDKDVTLDDAGDTRTPSAHTIASHSDTTSTGAQLDTAVAHSVIVTGNPHALDSADVGADPSGTAQGLLDAHDVLIDVHHNRDHTVASHSDTTATGAELNTLTGGVSSDADPLHTHPALANGPGVDTTAIHDNEASEISAITEKVSPAGGDFLIIEDVSAANVKKRVQVGNLPTGGGGEANLIAGVGTLGESIVADTPKTGITLNTKHVAPTSSKILVTADGNDNVLIDVGEANVVHQNLSGAGTNTHAQIDTHIADIVPAVNRNSKTGLTVNYAGILTINADDTKFDVAAGTGHILDFTADPENPTRVDLTWSSFLAETVPNLATEEFSVVYIEDTGGGVPGVFTNNIVPTSPLKRSKILIGTVGHANNVNINAVAIRPVIGVDTGACLDDFLDATGDFNISGNQFTPNGANLLFDRSAGVTFGRTVSTNLDSPHEKSTGLDTAIGVYVYSIRDGLTGDFLLSIETELQPQNYDNDGVLTAVGNNDFSIQRLVFDARSESTLVEFGQTTYNTLSEAIDGIAENAITKNPGFTSSVLRGWLVCRNNVTDLAAAVAGTTAVIREAITEISQPSGAGFDTNAVHVNQLGEISTVTAKTVPIGTDIVIIEDAADSFNKKQLELDDIVTSLTGPDADTRIATHTADADAHHTEAHTIASHSDTTATGAELNTLTDLSNADALHLHADFNDGTFRIQDNADATKEIAFQASTIATGTVRTITMPNADVTLDSAGDTRPPAAHTIASHSDTSATGSELNTLTDLSNADGLHLHADFNDSTFRIQDNTDPTKEIAFQASGITTGTVRTVTMPDANITIDDVLGARSPSGTAGGDLNGSYPNPLVDDGADGTAIHVTGTNQITGITEKTSVTGDDELAIDDEADSNNIKSVKIRRIVRPLASFVLVDPWTVRDNAAALARLPYAVLCTTLNAFFPVDTNTGTFQVEVLFGTSPASRTSLGTISITAGNQFGTNNISNTVVPADNFWFIDINTLGTFTGSVLSHRRMTITAETELD